MKKSILLILFLIMGFGSLPAVYGTGTGSETVYKASISYKDVNKTNWAYEPINEMSKGNIVKGYPDGSFKPNNTVTYAEFIKMSVLAATGEDPGLASSPNYWAQNYYDKAIKLGYFTEYDIHKTQLSNAIPRGDMALIISSILGDVKIETYDAIQNDIKDINYKTKNEYDITKAYYSGILTGYTDNTFRPDKTLSRAESATVIYRLVDESKRVLPKGEENITPSEPEQKTDISSVIENYEQIAKSREYLAGAKTYSIISDMSKYKVTLHENRGTKWIKINGNDVRELGFGNMYLVKDKNMVVTGDSFADGTYDGNHNIEHIDLATIDYFMFYNTTTKHITLMPNSYHK